MKYSVEQLRAMATTVMQEEVKNMVSNGLGDQKFNLFMITMQQRTRLTSDQIRLFTQRLAQGEPAS